MADQKAPAFPQFDNYACDGDSITWEKDGWTLTATIEADTDTRPDEFDCYSANDRADWRRDSWRFVGVVVSVSRNGVEVSEFAASLWGVECNFGLNNAHLAEVAQELEGEALLIAEKERKEIIKALSA